MRLAAASNPVAAAVGVGAPVGGQALTAGTATYSVGAQPLRTWSKFQITNAMVAALGASTTGDITVCTLPAKTIVYNALVVITGPAASLTALTLALGRTSALFIDFVLAADAKAAANTVYGDLLAEVGASLASLPNGVMPSFTATTLVKMHFISAVENLSAITAFGCDIYLETAILP